MSSLASATYALPRNYYLLVHDALRRLLGTEAELAAFVKTKKPFQCDMLVRSARTDCDVLTATPQAKEQFVQELNAELRVCNVTPRERRLDIVFGDKSVLRLALGAPRQSLEALAREQGSADARQSDDTAAAAVTTAVINAEKDWRRRNRLRISFGFDEELFLQSCSPQVRTCAEKLTKWAQRTVQGRRFFGRSPEAYDAFAAAHSDWAVVTPPPSFWYAHAYLAQRAFQTQEEDRLFEAVHRNFARYFGVHPFDNPYCPGEDLHTMDVARWICRTTLFGTQGDGVSDFDVVPDGRPASDARDSATDEADDAEWGANCDGAVDEERLRRLLNR